MKEAPIFALVGFDGAVILVIILLAIVLSAIAVFFLYRKLEKHIMHKLLYKREFSQSGVFAGESVIMTEKIYNPTPFFIFSLTVSGYINGELVMPERIYEPIDGMKEYSSKFTLPPFSEVLRKREILCTKRGEYVLESAVMIKGECEIETKSEALFYVYPKLEKTDFTPSALVISDGDYTGRVRLIEDSFSFSGIRDYVSGDPFREIDFKASAKSPTYSLKVKRRDYVTSRKALIYINLDSPYEKVGDDVVRVNSEDIKALSEYALSYAASLAEEAIRKGFSLSLRKNSKENGSMMQKTPDCAGVPALEEILKMLAKSGILPGISADGMLKADIELGITGYEIYFITRYLDEGIKSLLSDIAQNRNSVNVLMPTPSSL